MGLFDQVLGAISNPNQQATPDQFGMILNTLQQVGGQYGVDPAMSQTLLSLVGQHVRSSLQQKQANGGREEVASIINQFNGVNPNSQAVQAVFSPNQEQQVAQDVAQKTGISAQSVQMLLPVLIPLVLNFLQSGASPQGSQGNNNPVLNQFLDSDRDGDVDIGDAMAMAGRFLSQPR
ncbi:MAG: DUF937 domain-containing protein [Leptolyngbyaceae cyanobacterium bins.59]|nr:DUF937 domain-containing protein [Leptolyngbyaceae cyanobacterium bins.59]